MRLGLRFEPDEDRGNDKPPRDRPPPFGGQGRS